MQIPKEKKQMTFDFMKLWVLFTIDEKKQRKQKHIHYSKGKESDPCLNSSNTAADCEGVCWEFRKVDGMANLRFRVNIWSWMRESSGDITIVTPGCKMAGSCSAITL